MKRTKLRKHTLEDIIIDIIVYASCIFTIVVMLYPFLNVLAVSLNDPMDTIYGGITIYPSKITFTIYKMVLTDQTIYDAALISFSRTVLGTIATLLCTCLLGYIQSRRGFVFAKPISVMMLITMYFSAGIIPGYMLFKYLNLINNFLVYIVPGLFYGFNVIIIRTYMQSLPESLVESAMLDGANELRIFWSIVLPLSLPAVATVALFIAVGHWNSWFDTYMYAPKLPTLQYELMKKLDSVTSSTSQINPGQGGSTTINITATAVRAVYTVIVTVPIVAVYPFVQKYFVTGMTIGSVKG